MRAAFMCQTLLGTFQTVARLIQNRRLQGFLPGGRAIRARRGDGAIGRWNGRHVFSQPQRRDEAMRQAGAAPALSLFAGFSPQNLKIDGRYHTLKVSLTSKEKLNIQARHGYFAPRSIGDPAEATKEEIREALFSQEEIRDLPVELQTQFSRKTKLRRGSRY